MTIFILGWTVTIFFYITGFCAVIYFHLMEKIWNASLSVNHSSNKLQMIKRVRLCCRAWETRQPRNLSWFLLGSPVVPSPVFPQLTSPLPLYLTTSATATASHLLATGIATWPWQSTCRQRRKENETGNESKHRALKRMVGSSAVWNCAKFSSECKMIHPRL